MTERKAIPGADGYFVSDDGTLWSERPNPRLGFAAGEPHEMRLPVANHGYKLIRLPFNGTYRSVTVHQLVADAFLPPKPENHQEIRHLDGDKLNCAASNLAWGTRAQNQADAVRHGTRCEGSRNNLSKLTEGDVVRVRTLIADGLTNTQIATQFGVTRSPIWAIRNGKTWKHVAQETGT